MKPVEKSPKTQGPQKSAPSKDPKAKKFRFSLVHFLVLILGLSLLQSYFVDKSDTEVIPYSRFEQLLSEKRVSELRVSDSHIQGVIKEPKSGEKKQFVTNRVDPNLANTIQDPELVLYGSSDSNFLTTLLSWVLPALIFVGIWIFFMRRFNPMGGIGSELSALGKNKAKVYVEKDTKISFRDVAGVDEAKAELQEIVDFLKNPQEFGRLGGRMPKGILLIGPPGTGKTLLAKAVAGEAGVPFFSISGSEFVEMFVGVGAARVRDLFAQARSQGPAIIFIDELDALGKSRAASPLSGGHDEKEQTLNQLLVELDGFDSSSGIMLIAASNRPEILDPALLRAGRFDRQVLVDRPDRGGRVAILQVHMKKLPAIESGVNADTIAGLTPGFTGADLENLTNEAALVATRRKASSIALADFTEAIERIVAGLEKKQRILNPRERRIVAYHEMGHALVAASLETGDKVHKVSVIPRGLGALGYTIQRPSEDRFINTKAELEAKISVLLGGRAAESVIFGHLSTGASDDLVKATDIAWNMVTRWGMSGDLGHATYEREQAGFLGGSYEAPRRHGDATDQKIDSEVKAVLDICFDRAKKILMEGETVLRESAEALLASETLSENELEPYFARMPKRPERDDFDHSAQNAKLERQPPGRGQPDVSHLS